MSVTVQRCGYSSYVECEATGLIIKNERDVLDLIALCGEYDSNRVLFYQANFSLDLFDLKTKLAGTLFQKLANYRMRGAAVISFDMVEGDRFKELIFECNRGQLFRFFEDRAAAVAWLAGD
jgi:hypothetical protein